MHALGHMMTHLTYAPYLDVELCIGVFALLNFEGLLIYLISHFNPIQCSLMYFLIDSSSWHNLIVCCIYITDWSIIGTESKHFRNYWYCYPFEPLSSNRFVNFKYWTCIASLFTKSTIWYILLKKECTTKLSNTKSPERPQKTTQVNSFLHWSKHFTPTVKYGGGNIMA